MSEISAPVEARVQDAAPSCQTVVALTQQMVSAASAQSWESLAELQLERDRLVDVGGLAWTVDALRDVLALNARVADLVQQARDASGHRCAQLREQTRAIAAYRG